MEQVQARVSFEALVQEQATIEASFETSRKRANDHVNLSGEVDLGCSLPSPDDPDDPDYKPPSRACKKLSG